MSISVVIPTLNRWHFLDQCLASVAAQTYGKWEVIIINDGSDEPDTDAVRRKWTGPQFRWIDHRERRGISTARNSGILAAQYPLIFTLDNDDILHPECFERLRPHMEDTDVDCAYGDFELFGTFTGVRNFEELALSHLAVYQFIPAQVLMRKTLWEKAGGYSTHACFVAGNEDWDFWLSAAETGFRYKHVPEVLYRYRIHADGLSKSSLLREDYRTREEMYRRHRGFIDQHGKRREFLGSGYWRSASAFCKKGSVLKSLSLGFRAFTLQPDVAYARDLLRRNLRAAFGDETGNGARVPLGSTRCGRSLRPETSKPYRLEPIFPEQAEPPGASASRSGELLEEA